jgi:hypothetical protein
MIASAYNITREDVEYVVGKLVKVINVVSAQLEEEIEGGRAFETRMLYDGQPARLCEHDFNQQL